MQNYFFLCFVRYQISKCSEWLTSTSESGKPHILHLLVPTGCVLYNPVAQNTTFLNIPSHLLNREGIFSAHKGSTFPRFTFQYLGNTVYRASASPRSIQHNFTTPRLKAHTVTAVYILCTCTYASSTILCCFYLTYYIFYNLETVISSNPERK